MVSGAGAGTLGAMTGTGCRGVSGSLRQPRLLRARNYPVAAAARSTVRSLQSLGFVADPETLDAPIVLMARNV